MVVAKFVFVTVAVLIASASGSLDHSGRDLLDVDSCGSYGKCQAGYSCGTLKAKQCYKSPKPKERCTEEDACLEDLEMCGPELFCKYNEKCVKDAKCFAEWEAFVAAEKKPEKEIFEKDCFSCAPLEFEEECMTVDVEKCDNVKEEKCKLVPTEQCVDSPELECKKVLVEKCETVIRNKCEWIKEEVCQDVIQEVCTDVPSQVCTPGGPQCLDRNPCEIKPIGFVLCTTVEECTEEITDTCRRKQERCAGFQARRPGFNAGFCGDLPCVPERTCNQVEKCVTLTAPACGAKDAFPTARNECAAQLPHICLPFKKNICIDVPAGCQTVINKVCQPVAKKVCSFVDKQICKDVPEQVCKSVWEEQCETIFKRRCETINKQQCWPVWVRKCETKEVEKCAFPKGIECGKDTCKLGQKCGTECTIVEEEEEECKEVTIEACIPK